MRTQRLALIALLSSPFVVASACGGTGTFPTGGTGANGTGNSNGTGAGGSSSTLSLSSSGATGGTGGTINGSSSGATGGGGSMTSSGMTSSGTTSSGTTSSGTTSSGTTSSSSSSSTSTSGGGVTFGMACAPNHTTLTGVVHAPNGVDPIPNVRVYIPKATPLTPYPTLYCDQCSSPIDQNVWVATVSGFDGSFNLDLDLTPQSAMVPLAIQIGRFRKWTMVPVTCNANPQTITGTATNLPGATVAGVADVPNILVSAGNVDHLDTVLFNLGITQYTCVEGRASPFYPYGGKCSNLMTGTPPPTKLADVLTNAAELNQYHMAFLSCAPDAYDTYITPVGSTSKGGHNGQGYSQSTFTTNTFAWVQNNYGRLFVTDTAYDYVAQPFPAGITWEGPPGTPQPVDGANVGCAPGTSPHTVAYPITIDEPQLSQWLTLVGHPAPVTVDGFYEPWSVMASLPTNTQLIANGTLPLDPTIVGTTCAMPETMTNVPLTARFEVPACGRVIFSSYHTDSAASTTANEKIMEYLIFEAAYCHM